MKTTLAFLLLCLTTTFALANTAPTPVIVSATMRPTTTLMDVVYRVNDPDDATVKVRALAFVNGTRSFANVIKPTAFVEGTAANLGDAITTNADHTLTWDVAVDWSIDVGQLKVEILALDSRGLLQFDWIAIPAAGGNPALTISKDTPASNKVLDALFWQYASGDPGMSLASGVVTGTAASGVFNGLQLASGTTPNSAWSALYFFKTMNLDPATSDEVTFSNTTARAGLLNTGSWHASNRPYAGIVAVVSWGDNVGSLPVGINDIVGVASGCVSGHVLALKSDGTLIGWGNNSSGQVTIPTGLNGVAAMAAGSRHSLALKGDGTVFAWGSNNYGQTTIPVGLSGVIAIAAGGDNQWFIGGGGHSLALKDDGTVVGWGHNNYGQTTIPAGLNGVVAIAAGGAHSLALKGDGTVVAWGSGDFAQLTIPAGLNGIVAIAAGATHNLALKSDGTVVAWGGNTDGQTTIPAALSGVVAIAAGAAHSLALKGDGTVVAWGHNGSGQINVPVGLGGITAIAAGASHSIAFKPKAL
jgi:hypothetical protein